MRFNNYLYPLYSYRFKKSLIIPLESLNRFITSRLNFSINLFLNRTYSCNSQLVQQYYSIYGHDTITQTIGVCDSDEIPKLGEFRF